MDPISALFTTYGAVALLVSWVILLISSSKEDFTWGLCTFFLPPLSYCYGLLRLDIAKDSIVLAIAGCILVLAGIT